MWWDHVRGVSSIFGLIFRVQASVILLGRPGQQLGAAPAGLAAVVFLYVRGGMSGSREGTWLLGEEHVGVVEVMRIVRVMVLIGAEARIQVGVVIAVGRG